MPHRSRRISTGWVRPSTRIVVGGGGAAPIAAASAATKIPTRPTRPTWPPTFSYARAGRRLLRARRRRAHGRVLDPELFEIGLVLGRVVVILLHLGPVLRHRLLVEPDGRLVFGANQRDVLRGLRLNV